MRVLIDCINRQKESNSENPFPHFILNVEADFRYNEPLRVYCSSSDEHKGVVVYVRTW